MSLTFLNFIHDSWHEGRTGILSWFCLLSMLIFLISRGIHLMIEPCLAAISYDTNNKQATAHLLIIF